MPQAIQIETQSEQQGLTLLRAQRVARRTGRELALHRTEQALDQRSASVEASRECSSHFGAHSMDALRFLSTLGGNHTARPELFPDTAVEFGVGQHQPDARLLEAAWTTAGNSAQSFHGHVAICDNTN